MKFSVSFLISLCGLLSLPLSGARVITNTEESQIMAMVHATGHSFECYLPTYKAELDVDPSSGVLKSAHFTFSTIDLTTEHKKRDRKMHEWIGVEGYPVAEYTLQSVREEDGQLIAVGTFKMHGVEQSIEMPYSVVVDGDQVVLKSDFVLDYTNWNLEIIRMMFMTVRPGLDISVSLVGSIES